MFEKIMGNIFFGGLLLFCIFVLVYPLFPLKNKLFTRQSFLANKDYILPIAIGALFVLYLAMSN